ncbi:MAG: hypothetical protein GY909_04695 [Oligoflexia bacterium]|nr:hypothetical protein [Oligoflexia bacterium]
MSSKLELNVEISSDEVEIKLKGIIDEDSDFGKATNLNAKSYVFDFKDIESINSCGIREWINYLGTISDDAKIVYRNCTQVIIEQMGMVKGFVKEGAVVESLFAPYFCEDCDDEFKHHLNVSEIIEKKAPAVKCPKCSGENTEFDAIEAQYFSFIK